MSRYSAGICALAHQDTAVRRCGLLDKGDFPSNGDGIGPFLPLVFRRGHRGFCILYGTSALHMIQGSPIDLCVDSLIFPGASQVPQDLPHGRTFSFAYSLDFIPNAWSPACLWGIFLRLEAKGYLSDT